jgi:hypothetical protein
VRPVALKIGVLTLGAIAARAEAERLDERAAYSARLTSPECAGVLWTYSPMGKTIHTSVVPAVQFAANLRRFARWADAMGVRYP